MKQITIVIPTFNAAELLQKNLPACFAALSDGDEVLVVDDEGTDTTAAWMKETFKLEEILPEINNVPEGYFPHPDDVPFAVFQKKDTFHKKEVTVTLVHLKRNLRFAGAANIGVLLAKNELVFLCNNDVVLEKKCLEFLRPHFDAEAVFAVGCMEYEDSNRDKKSGKNILYFERGLFQHNRASDFTSGETAWASGGSALFDRYKWLELNGFDRAFYPAYWEDIDLSYRARRQGWKVLFESNAVVYHKHESTHSDLFGQKKIAQMSWRNAFVFTWKNASFLERLQYLLWLPYWVYKSQ